MESGEWLPHLTVATIIERDGRFLLVEEYADGEELVYNQPAGHLDAHETLAAGAIRETLEETAWKWSVSSAVVGVYYWTHPKGHTFVRTCFAGAALYYHPNQRLDDGIERTVWLTRDEVAALGKICAIPWSLRYSDYLAGKRYPLELFSYL